MYEFKLPDLGEGIHEGEILKWHVQVGEHVEEDAPLVDVETDKAAVTIPSPCGGIVQARNAEAGQMVKVGQVLVVIADGKDAADRKNAADGKDAAVVISAPQRTDGPVPAAPATRRLAREQGVDLHHVVPSGPAGRVTADDVRQYAAQHQKTTSRLQEGPVPVSEVVPAPAPAAVSRAVLGSSTPTPIPLLDIEPLPDFSSEGPLEVVPLRSIRRRVARKMVTSMVLVPHVAHIDEADVTALDALRLAQRERLQDRPGGRLTLLPFLVKAVTACLKQAPEFNASLDPFKEEILYKHYYNLGIAVDTPQGLMVPVVRATDRKSVLQLSAEMADLAEQAREGRIRVDDLRHGTFTITNVGALGGTAVIPTINYPEVAILGLGRMQQKPVVRDGEIVIRSMLPMTLAFDHRVADGAQAARFMSHLVALLSDPAALAVES